MVMLQLTRTMPVAIAVASLVQQQWRVDRAMMTRVSPRSVRALSVSCKVGEGPQGLCVAVQPLQPIPSSLRCAL